MATGWRRGDAPGELAPIELAEATPGPGRVAIAVEAVALDDVSATPRGRVPGTAAVGTVTAVGPAADEWLGARVLVPALEGCGECERCRRGGVAVCAAGSHRGVTGPGALATAITAGARWLVRLDGGLALPGPAAAGLGAELAWAYALYARASLGPRDPVVILGAGARARAAAAIATAKGATAVVATDDAATAARLGERQCPIHTAAIEEALAAAGADPRPRKLLVTDGRHLEAALRVANPRATVVVAAAPTGPMLAPLEVALAGEVTIAGVAGCHPDLLPELAALAVRGDLALADLVDVVPLAELSAALAARADRPTATGLVVELPR